MTAMHDIIWTIIVIWLIYKTLDVFKVLTAKKPSNSNNTSFSATSYPRKDIKSAVQKHLNNEGEYIDFEEVK